MNKMMSLTRIAILFGLSMLAVPFIFGEETGSGFSWMLAFLTNKALGIAAFFATAKLYTRWSKTDPWLKAYERMIRKELSHNNPARGQL